MTRIRALSCMRAVAVPVAMKYPPMELKGSLIRTRIIKSIPYRISKNLAPKSPIELKEEPSATEKMPIL